MNSVDIEKLAKLARIEIGKEEGEKLGGEIESILAYVGELQKVSLTSDHTTLSLSHKNVMREDGNPHESGLHTGALVSAAPLCDDGLIKVKKILS